MKEQLDKLREDPGFIKGIEDPRIKQKISDLRLKIHLEILQVRIFLEGSTTVGSYLEETAKAVDMILEGVIRTGPVDWQGVRDEYQTSTGEFDSLDTNECEIPYELIDH